MDSYTLSALRDRLIEEHDRLETEVERIRREGYESLSEESGENNYRDHMADQGSATFTREMDLTLDGNLRFSLAAVKTALKRLEDGTYNICEHCCQPIAIERLEAMPTVTLCIKCKSEEESR